jgi:hypothetical protein
MAGELCQNQVAAGEAFRSLRARQSRRAKPKPEILVPQARGPRYE